MLTTTLQAMLMSGLLATGVFACKAAEPTMSADAMPTEQPDAPITKTITAATKFNFTTFDAPGAPGTTVNGINNQGAVVGFTTTTPPGGDPVNANFIRAADGTYTTVTLHDPAGSANALNSSGEVVGTDSGSAFSLKTNMLTVLTPFGVAASVAFAVNDEGVIAGQYTQDANTMPGFVDVDGTYTSISPTTASTMTFVASVNSNNLAAGFFSEDGTTQHAFTYDVATQKIAVLGDPVTTRIATSPLVLTQFLSINDHDQVAGYYQTTDGSQYGFVYDLATSTYIFLDHPMAAPVAGVQITQITGIDNANEIAGFFIDVQGDQHGFVASPTN